MLKEFFLTKESWSLSRVRTWRSRIICSLTWAWTVLEIKSWKGWALQVRQTRRQKGQKWIPWNMLQTQHAGCGDHRATTMVTDIKGHRHTHTYANTDAHMLLLHFKAERGRGIKAKTDNGNCQTKKPWQAQWTVALPFWPSLLLPFHFKIPILMLIQRLYLQIQKVLNSCTTYLKYQIE